MGISSTAYNSLVVDSLNCTINSGSTASGEIDCGGATLAGVQLPASFTGTSIGFQVSTTQGGTYTTLYDGFGSAYSKTVSQGQAVTLDPAIMWGWRYVKVVSGSSEGGTRLIGLSARFI